MADSIKEESIVRMDGEYDAILPDGYSEGDDIFNSDSWADAQADAPAAAEEKEPAPEEQTDGNDAPTTGEEVTTAEDSADKAEEQPTQQPEAKPAKLKFRATVDHTDKDVELDEADLPSIYQKAQVVDRVQAKLGKITPEYEEALRVAKMLKYDSISEMLAAAKDSYKDAEVQKLMREGATRTIAEDYVSRKMADTNKGPSESEDSPSQDKRDYREEARELLEEFPHLAGKQIPQEVVNDAIRSGKHLKEAYRLYSEKQSRAEAEALRKKNSDISKENKILKQNAEAARRAPVSGVSKGGATNQKAEDDFLRGFNSGWD